MKTKILNIIGALLIVLGFTACSDDHTSGPSPYAFLRFTTLRQ